MLDIVEDSDTFFVCALFYVDYLINSHLGHYDQCQFAPEDDTNLHESQAAASRSGTFAKNEICVFFWKWNKMRTLYCTWCCNHISLLDMVGSESELTQIGPDKIFTALMIFRVNQLFLATLTTACSRHQAFLSVDVLGGMATRPLGVDLNRFERYHLLPSDLLLFRKYTDFTILVLPWFTV